MRILLIEDDISTAKSIELALATEGIVCDIAGNGEEGLDFARMYEYDIIILDMMLPDVDGFEVLRRLRRANIKTPVMILSGLTGSDSKVKGLGIGADDYVTKPFNRGELIARIQAIVRRSKGNSTSKLKVGKISLDMDARSVEIGGKPMNLTSKEYSILEIMMLRKGTPIKKETFLAHLYGGIDEPEIKIIDVFVCKLRKKIEEVAGENYIETLWGRGYCIKDPNEKNILAGNENQE
ncbi:MAG: response regulator transcription factor [Rickettsiales bacterium]|nr:response regulator transcription factor [Rickettsiales bacterium]